LKYCSVRTLSVFEADLYLKSMVSLVKTINSYSDRSNEQWSDVLMCVSIINCVLEGMWQIDWLDTRIYFSLNLFDFPISFLLETIWWRGCEIKTGQRLRNFMNIQLHFNCFKSCWKFADAPDHELNKTEPT
jgi:hypothetical protein